MMLASCSASRELTKEERTVPPEMLETAYNLVRAKLVKLQLVEKVVVEIDTVGCSRNYSMKYDSWFLEMLDIGHRLERNDIRYKLSVRGKPYIHSRERITLDNPGNLFYTRYDDGFAFGDMKQILCKETVPDTALERIRLSAFVLDACQEDYLPMTSDEAITIARRTFQLDSSIPCVHAWAHKGRYEGTNYFSICNISDAGFWGITFKLEPTDTTVYYNLKMDTELGEEEIRRIIKEEKRRDGVYEYPAIILVCRVDAETGNICSVNIAYRLSTQGGDIPERLYPFERRINSIRDSLATEYWR
jgi:hypothetical protein